MFGQRLRIDVAAKAALEQLARLLEPHLSSFEESGAGFIFPAPFADGSPLRESVSDMRLDMVKSPKFLGGVYGSILSAVVETNDAALLPIAMRYSGKVMKGAPNFIHGKGAVNSLTERLNDDDALIRMLHEQDLEVLDILSEGDGKARINMRPYGGGFVYMIFPPMKYAVRLKQGHAEIMALSVQRLAAHVAGIDPVSETLRSSGEK